MVDDGERPVKDSRAGENRHAEAQPLQHTTTAAADVVAAAKHVANRMAQRLDQSQRMLRAQHIHEQTDGVQWVMRAE